MYNFIVCGSRFWERYDIIAEYLSLIPSSWTLIEGECDGADIIARQWWDEAGNKYEGIRAAWKKYGKSAGPIRNSIMVNKDPCLALIFHDNIEESKGTKDIVKKMEKKNIRQFVISSISTNVIREITKKELIAYISRIDF